MRRPNGTGTVFKSGRNWVIQYTVGYDINGKRIRKKKRGFQTKKEAILYLETLRKEKPKASIDTLWQTYLKTDYLKLSKDKQKHYLTVYERLQSIHKTDINNLTILDLQSLIEPYTSYYAQKDIKTVLSHLYNIAIAQQYCTTNLTQYMRLRPHKEKEGTAWTVDQMNTFWKMYEDSNDEFCGYILFMCYTGAMPGELRTIQRSMIDYEAHEIRGAGLKTDTRKEAPIILADRIIPVLQDLMRDRICLWTGSKHQFYDEYEKCLKRCGIEYKPPYTCRHTAATLLANETDALTTQKIMRHARVTTTQRYVHPNSESLITAVNKM